MMLRCAACINSGSAVAGAAAEHDDQRACPTSVAAMEHPRATLSVRPVPLYFAERLSEHFGNRIHLKREYRCHTGAHKVNNALGQALLAVRMGKRRIIAETGAGQHGVAVATLCARFGLDCAVYMGREDMLRQAVNVRRMELLGAEVSVDAGDHHRRVGDGDVGGRHQRPPRASSDCRQRSAWITRFNVEAASRSRPRSPGPPLGCAPPARLRS